MRRGKLAAAAESLRVGRKIVKQFYSGQEELLVASRSNWEAFCDKAEDTLQQCIEFERIVLLASEKYPSLKNELVEAQFQNNERPAAPVSTDIEQLVKQLMASSTAKINREKYSMAQQRGLHQQRPPLHRCGCKRHIEHADESSER